jgi:hypothetical protein
MGGIDWYDTELIKRQLTATSVLVIGIWIMMAVLILMGLLTVMRAIVGGLIGFAAFGIGAYFGLRGVLKRDPTSVGLSAIGIRLRFHDGHHKDIPWNDVDGIVYIGSSRPTKIIHKNGSFTPVVVPKRIRLEMETRFQKIRKG